MTKTADNSSTSLQPLTSPTNWQSSDLTATKQQKGTASAAVVPHPSSLLPCLQVHEAKSQWRYVVQELPWSNWSLPTQTACDTKALAWNSHQVVDIFRGRYSSLSQKSFTCCCLSTWLYNYHTKEDTSSFGAFRYYVQHPVICNRKCSTFFNHTLRHQPSNDHASAMWQAVTDILDVLGSISKVEILKTSSLLKHIRTIEKPLFVHVFHALGNYSTVWAIDWIHQASTITNPSSDLRALRALSAVLQGLGFENIWPPLKQHIYGIYAYRVLIHLKTDAWNRFDLCMLLQLDIHSHVSESQSKVDEGRNTAFPPYLLDCRALHMAPFS